MLTVPLPTATHIRSLLPGRLESGAVGVCVGVFKVAGSSGGVVIVVVFVVLEGPLVMETKQMVHIFIEGKVIQPSDIFQQKIRGPRQGSLSLQWGKLLS